MRSRIAFLLSGAGSTLVNLLDHIERGNVDAEIVVVLSDREGVKGLEIAREHGIAVGVVSRRAYQRERYSAALEEALRPHAPDLVVSGGFLTIYDVPPDLEGRMINVHPSLLPAFGGKGFYGNRVHRAVLERGCRISGCTVHIVNSDVDGGPILEQQAVDVLDDDTIDTLAARVQEAERELYPRVIADLLSGRTRLEGGQVVRTKKKKKA